MGLSARGKEAFIRSVGHTQHPTGSAIKANIADAFKVSDFEEKTLIGNLFTASAQDQKCIESYGTGRDLATHTNKTNSIL